MAVKITGAYQGNKRVELRHEDSGVTLITDAPRDNQGEGKSFSPTDLMAAALGSCIMTTIAIVADRGAIDVSGMRMEVEKHMVQDPRRIGRLPVVIHMPQSLLEHERQKLERAGLACPVHKSLLSEIPTEITFVYDV